MVGLVSYVSSNEDSDDEHRQEEPVENTAKLPEVLPVPAAEEVKPTIDSKPPKQDIPTTTQQTPTQEPEAAPLNPIHQNAVPLGPSLPPMDTASPTNDTQEQEDRPQSPYSKTRTSLQNLTLPAIPNLDIPPSPPGSPPPGANKKFEQFLTLKKQGTHFNSKLEQSTALRNPALMDKLMGFVGVDGAEQYGTTLPPDLWDPKAFPQWAFRGTLKKTRERVAKEKETERANGGRTTVDFVSSAAVGGGATRRSG